MCSQSSPTTLRESEPRDRLSATEQPRKSDQAIKRALDMLEPGSKERAEALALLGRNAKAGWLDAWRPRPRAEWREEALRCSNLREAYDYYLKGFKADLNNFYAGLNALAMGRSPLNWPPRFPRCGRSCSRTSRRPSPIVHSETGHRFSRFRCGDGLSRRLRNGQRDNDVWLQVSKADLTLLTSKRPGRVAERYRRAVVDVPPSWPTRSWSKSIFSGTWAW